MNSALGIDFGGTTVKIGIVEGSKLVSSVAPISTQDFQDRDALISEIVKRIEEVRTSYPDLSAIGVGVPGFVDFKTGTIANLTNVVGWKEVPLKTILEEQTGLPCTVENDANAMAYAEWKLGAGKGYEHLVALTLGTGVGGGIIVNNQLVRGAKSGAGELGQTSVDYRGRVGAYGNPGALEDYIGNREIIQEAIRFYKHKGVHKTAEDLTPADLSDLADLNDETALEIWDWVAEKLACTLMNVCYMLNPETIIIGGGVSKAGDLIFNPLREKLEEWLSPTFTADLKILPAHFGNEAGMIGCARLAREEAGLE